MTASVCRVFLVGAGPGDPGLITRRGLELLQRCDVLLYDRLVAPSLVDEAPQEAERIFVGKDPNRPSPPQAAIDALIVRHARAGRTVVRLKGGDPYVFGRGADEAQALAAAGIAFEVVPGVSAAVAAPAYAGIPVTHSGLSSSFTVLTAHESADRPGSAERWSHLAMGAETLVILMGVASLEGTTRRLIDAGRDPNEPAAVVEWGATPAQRVVSAPLSKIAEAATEAGVRSPATTIVGPVVKLRGALAWFEARPLFGRRVVVTRARSQAAGLISSLEELGVRVVAFPTIEVIDPPSWDALDGAIQKVADGFYEWIVLSSANGVERFMGRLAAAGLDARALAGVRIAAVGPRTQEKLAGNGLVADLVPETFTGSAMAEAIGRGSGHVLMVRPLDAPRDVPDRLRELGWAVDAAPAYATIAAPVDQDLVDEIRNGDFDALTFTSGSTVRNFVAAVGPGDARRIAGPDSTKRVFCIGPIVAEAAREAGLRVDAIAEPHTTEALVEAVRLGLRSPLS